MKKNDYQVVDKITKKLKPNEIYKVENHDILKPIVGNRGKATGVERGRVKHYVTLMLEGLFFDDISIIIVNYYGKIIDGANRTAAAKECNRPIYIKITDNPLLNVKDDDTLLDNIAIVNGSSPTWKARQHFDSAKISNSPLAMTFADLKAALVADDSLGIVEKDLTTNQMYTFLTRNAKELHGMKRNRVAFKNQKLNEKANAPEFQEELKYICKVIRYFKIGSIRPSKILEALMPLIWDNTIDANVFLTNLLNKGFRFNAKEVIDRESIRAKVLKLSGVKIA